MILRLHGLFFTMFLLVVNCIAQNKPIKNSSLPAWIKDISIEFSASDSGATSAGYYYLLVDNQVNIANAHHFSHLAIKILNNEGVQQMSDLSFDYDPSYQKLVFHQISIIRGNKEISRLKEQNFKLVQRENNMERHMYDGMMTAVVNLTDIRVGDIIEYAYSIIGDNPIFEGHFDAKYYFQYNLPVEHLFTRLTVPEKRTIKFKYFNGARQPQIERTSEYLSYAWDYSRMKSLMYDINTPSWYDAAPGVSVSDYESWGAIVNQYAKWYTIDDREKKQLEKNIKDLTWNSILDSSIIQIIRFVQDDIRYLAFEDGINSHKPDLPIKVFRQRYGDCKAKSFLLCEMLKVFGIEAFPVLVSSSNGNIIENNLPSPDLFDHCIVQIKRYGKLYYIDPTLSNQGGDLEHYYCPDYHKGLVLKSGEDSLISLPFWGYTKTKVTETFKINEIGNNASLYVNTVYTGGEADAQRAAFEGSDLESTQKNYINFYSKLFPTIHADGNIRIIDTREISNEFVTEEHYIIDSLWERSADNPGKLTASFYPLSFESLVSGKQSPKRTMPFAVKYPLEYEHTTVLELPSQWNIEASSESIRTGSFLYNHHIYKTGNSIFVTHSYKTLREYISPGETESFIAKHNEILNKLSYSLTYNKNLIADKFKISWAALVLVLVTLIGSLVIAIRIGKHYDVSPINSPNNALPIGGWLVLIGIGLILSPFRILLELIKTPTYFNHNTWISLFQVYGNAKGLMAGALLIFELIYNIVVPVYFVLAAFLFFKRRTVFPKIAIILYIVIFVVALFDYLASTTLNPSAFTHKENLSSYRSIVQNFILAAVWIPYLLYSERVKSTFVFQSKINQKRHDLIKRDPEN